MTLEIKKPVGTGASPSVSEVKVASGDSGKKYVFTFPQVVNIPDVVISIPGKSQDKSTGVAAQEGGLSIEFSEIQRQDDFIYEWLNRKNNPVPKASPNISRQYVDGKVQITLRVKNRLAAIKILESMGKAVPKNIKIKLRDDYRKR